VFSESWDTWTSRWEWTTPTEWCQRWGIGSFFNCIQFHKSLTKMWRILLVEDKFYPTRSIFHGT
jgi:hypothetical protein